MGGLWPPLPLSRTWEGLRSQLCPAPPPLVRVAPSTTLRFRKGVQGGQAPTQGPHWGLA